MSKPQSHGRMKELSKFGASYYAGLTIEADPDPSTLKLAIDGERIRVRKVGRSFVPPKEVDSPKRGTLSALTREIVDTFWDYNKREAVKQNHLAELGKGFESWNRWRREHPDIRPLLFGATLTRQNLSGFNFCNANLIGADLRRATLKGANFHEANLGGAKLMRADLTGANFCRTDLYETNLFKADLTGANLQGTQLARTNFECAKLIGCTIYGLSAWDLKLEGAVQEDLRILYKVEKANGEWDQGEFIVDNLEAAQFVYLLLDNKRITKVFDSMTSKAVLIMGRFVPESRKAVLETLRSELRARGFIPIVFDFKKPKDRDFTETIKTLVGLCQFVIVDITNPKSSPLELDATVRDYEVPFVPIIQKDEQPFSMFKDLSKYPWMLKLVSYGSKDILRSVAKPLIIDRALKMHKSIQRRKARRETDELSAEEFLASRANKRQLSRGASA